MLKPAKSFWKTGTERSFGLMGDPLSASKTETASSSL
jgi:hypothetical protein